MTELTRDEALIALSIWWMRCTQTERMSFDRAKGIAREAINAAPPEIRSALTGTGGGEHQPPDAPDGYWWKRCQEAEARAADNARTRDEMEGDCRKANTRCGEALRANKDLKSRLAAAEKELDEQHAKMVRIADEKRAAEKRAEEAESGAVYEKCKSLIAERDALKAELDALRSDARQNDLEYVARFNAQAKEIDALKAELAHAEMQRDAALARVKELEALWDTVSTVIRSAAGAQS